jgi:hypothetical protein
MRRVSASRYPRIACIPYLGTDRRRGVLPRDNRSPAALLVSGGAPTRYAIGCKLERCIGADVLVTRV